MFAKTPFSISPFSSFTRSVEASAVLEAIATLTAQGVAPAANLDAIASVLASPTLRSSDAQTFIWTTPSRPTTWNIPTEVGASTWVVPK